MITILTLVKDQMEDGRSMKIRFILIMQKMTKIKNKSSVTSKLLFQIIQNHKQRPFIEKCQFLCFFKNYHNLQRRKTSKLLRISKDLCYSLYFLVFNALLNNNKVVIRSNKCMIDYINSLQVSNMKVIIEKQSYLFGGQSQILPIFYIYYMNQQQAIAIDLYLQSPNQYPRPCKDQQKHFVYLLTYIGELFVQGYRLIQKFDNILLFRFMEYQPTQQSQEIRSRYSRKLPALYKIVLWQMSQDNVFDSCKTRKQLYKNLLQIGVLFEDVEYNIIYLHSFKYSILNVSELQKIAQPICRFYYNKIAWIQQRNGLKSIHQKQQGIAMHQLVQLFLKGAGEARNLQIIRRMQRHNKFVYDLFKVINTVCYIIGKQILENDYQTISIEKWMRMATKKKFKRFDLLLRNQQKCSIIDWKFSRLQAQQKIKGKITDKKNKVYYQLATKDFKTNIYLKFYCFHERILNMYYHFLTDAEYLHKIEEISIFEPQILQIDNQSEGSSEKMGNPVIIQNQDLYRLAEADSLEPVQQHQMRSLPNAATNQVNIINLIDDQIIVLDQEENSISKKSCPNSQITIKAKMKHEKSNRKRQQFQLFLQISESKLIQIDSD